MTIKNEKPRMTPFDKDDYWRLVVVSQGGNRTIVGEQRERDSMRDPRWVIVEIDKCPILKKLLHDTVLELHDMAWESNRIVGPLLVKP